MGRRKVSKKLLVEHACALDAQLLQRSGVFDQLPGYSEVYRWKRADGLKRREISITIRLVGTPGVSSAMRLCYVASEKDAGQTSYDYRVELSFTPNHFGGGRWWFICPLIVRRACLPASLPHPLSSSGAIYFGCRQCHDLTYESRQKHRNPHYERCVKPLRVIRRTGQELKHIRSSDRLRRKYRQMEKARATVKEFFLVPCNNLRSETRS
jgi:hypothetical protein